MDEIVITHCDMPAAFMPETCSQWAAGYRCRDTGGRCLHRRRERVPADRPTANKKEDEKS